MAKAYTKIRKGLEEALHHAKTGRGAAVYRPVDIKALRRQLHMSQPQFADALQISVATLRHWEAGDREPRGPARALLLAVQREPETVMRALRVPRVTGRH
jgi:putative transcriptional regulator